MYLYFFGNENEHVEYSDILLCLDLIWWLILL